MSCKKCGFQSETSDRFCIECGEAQPFPEPVDVNQSWESIQEPKAPLPFRESEDVNSQSIDCKKQINKEDILAFIDGLVGKTIALYNDGYESAFVGVVDFAPAQSEFNALYDWNKCIEILAYDLGYDWNTEEAFQAEEVLASGLSFLFRETDPIFLHWWNSDDTGVAYLDGYEDALVGLIYPQPLSAEPVALYDWSKCIEILASSLFSFQKILEISESTNAAIKSIRNLAESRLSLTIRKTLFRETDPAFLFRFPGFLTSEELHELHGDHPSLLDWA